MERVENGTEGEGRIVCDACGARFESEAALHRHVWRAGLVE